MGEKRIVWMDLAKAMGILVVLVVHTGASLGPVTFLGGMFYMPVFFVLAGMTFSYRPQESFFVFVKKKARRLLVPYFGYNLFLFLVFFLQNNVLAGKVDSASFFPLLGILYSRYCLLPQDAVSNVFFLKILNTPTWFLTGLFVSLVIFWGMMRICRGDLKKLMILDSGVLLFSVLLHYLCPVLLPWSVDTAFYAVSFLTFGKVVAQRELVEKIYQRPGILLLLAALFAGLSMVNGSVNMSVAFYGRSMILYLAVGSLGSLLCMEAGLFAEKHLPVLSRAGAWVGRHTMPILCLHLLGYSVIGMVLRAVRGI